MTNPFPNQQPAPGVPNVNQPANPVNGVPTQTTEVVQERTVPVAGSTAVETKKKKNWLWWLIPLILIPLLAGIAWLVLGDRNANDTDTVETTTTDVVETTVTDELAPAPAPIEDQNPVITETLDPVAPIDPAAPAVPPAVNPDGAVVPGASAPEQAPNVVDPVVPGADQMAPAPAPAPAQ